LASRELSILLRARGALQASKDIGKVDSAVGRLSSHAKSGARAAAGSLARLGVVAAGAISLAVKSGLQDLATLESAISSVDGAIAQMGKSGGLTGAKIAAWANEIEASIGAAFDDKDITRATTTLLRFGKVTPTNLRPAMVVMTDLATKTGDVESAAALLAKAMAAPEKAAGKLARAGVILTKEQQAQIKAMVKVGDVAGAQKLLLDALSQTTKGAALASQGPYQRALSRLADVSEDARKALAEGFLPVIEKVADWLSKGLANPAVMQQIRDFGKGLAGGFDSLIGVAKNIPWSSIGDAMKLAGAGGKALLDAFVGLPPWVQTAVLTGWGLNKLTGGAIGGIVGELGKGLIKGVLGMNAGVVNINAGVVNGGGGLPGGPTPSGGGGVGNIIKSAAKILIPLAVADALLEASKSPEAQAYRAAGGNGTKGFVGKPGAARPAVQRVALSERQEAILASQARSMDALEANRLELVTKAQATTNAVNAAKVNQIAAQRTGDASIVSAIRGIKLSVTVPVVVKVAGGYTHQTATTLVRIGGNAARGAGAGA